MSLEHSWMELGACGKGDVSHFLSQQGHACLVGTERDQGGWGQSTTGVNQVGRVEAYSMDCVIET